jgi:tetratricopeptide (TPR) repeat protein
MTFITDLLGTLAFRSRAISALAERRATVAGGICFSVGYLLYALVRSLVYASLPELMSQRSLWIGYFTGLQLFQILLFLLVIYIPFVILASNAIAGDGLGLSISKHEYQAHVSALLPLWGALSLFAAPLQYFVPHFLIIGVVEISIGMLIRSILVIAYTLWAIRRLNYLSAVQVLGTFALSWFTFPVYYLLTSFLLALPFFVLIPLIFLVSQWFRGYHASQVNERDYRQHLHALTVNPQDADAQYQLGLIYLKRRNLDAACRYFENALKIDPGDADYHYFLARAHELKGEWSSALEQYEETYRLNPEYGLGDIFREVGKSYLHVGNAEKAMEFLKFFLSKRGSDPEGRYWLAVALQKTGDSEQMRAQLHIIAEQARSNPRFFRKENREWIYRAREIIRDSRFEIRD